MVRAPRRLVGVDRGVVLAVHGHQARGLAEDVGQDGRIVYQQVASAAAHEDLDAAGLARREAADVREVVIAGPEVERVVRQRRARGQGATLFQGRGRERRRLHVGHVHEAGDPASHRRPRFVGEVGLVGEAGLAEVDLIVDQAGQQVLAAGLDGRIGETSGEVAGDGLDAAGLHVDVGLDDGALVDQAGVGDEDAGARRHGGRSWHETERPAGRTGAAAARAAAIPGHDSRSGGRRPARSSKSRLAGSKANTNSMSSGWAPMHITVFIRPPSVSGRAVAARQSGAGRGRQAPRGVSASEPRRSRFAALPGRPATAAAQTGRGERGPPRGSV